MTVCRTCIEMSLRVCSVVLVGANLVDERRVADVEARQRLRSASSSSLIVGRTRLSTVGD